jgi:hypothetical protein
MTNKIKTFARTLGLAGLLALGVACSGEIKEPARTNYTNSVLRTGYNNLLARDIDGDGEVDVLVSEDFRYIAYVREGMSREYVQRNLPYRSCTSLTKQMSSNLQAAATALLRADNEFGYNLHRENYNNWKKMRENKK